MTIDLPGTINGSLQSWSNFPGLLDIETGTRLRQMSKVWKMIWV